MYPILRGRTPTIGYRRGYITAAVIDRGIWGVNHIHIRDIMPPQGQHMGFAKVVMALSLSDVFHPGNTMSTR